jgi:hypothetical protein
MYSADVDLYGCHLQVGDIECLHDIGAISDEEYAGWRVYYEQVTAQQNKVVKERRIRVMLEAMDEFPEEVERWVKERMLG